MVVARRLVLQLGLRVDQQSDAVREEWDRELTARTHPVVVVHPITGRKVIYVNPGFTECINGMSRQESDDILGQLYEHVLQPRFRYDHRWSVGDVLMWDNLGVIHRGTLDYTPAEPRLMTRSLILGDKVFDPAFVRTALGAA